ncbi:MAG: phospho-N-acetylmuramoyl-pentapeptide-transferase [Oscillospiraceae bacterium]|nr:phospho-N-acetylmuramoyl-pentapeptide-transferase [Oscillospiraceae bacterium]
MDIALPIIAAVAGFIITATLGIWAVPFLKRLKFGQTILEIGPKWHKAKEGTPTMGGLMFITGTVLAAAVALGAAPFLGQNLNVVKELKLSFRVAWLAGGFLMALAMSFIGFIDDYIKVVKKQNLGLTARQKTFFQLLIAAGYLATLHLSGMTTTYLPFYGDLDIEKGAGLLFWPIALLFIYGFTNAVNLTDGVDGLAASVTAVVAVFFMLTTGALTIATMNVAASALAGSCIGFLVYNLHPAKVFMGDTGSMFLGGMVVALAFGCGRPILLILAGVIYFAEALSVMIQVAYYKRTKKRLFKMTPIHHHFELSGWSEDKIVLVFCLVTAIFCAVAYLPMYFNI